MLGWFLYLSTAFKVGWLDKLCESLSSTKYSGSFKFLMMFEKKLFREFATFTSLDVILSLFTKIKFSMD